MYRSAYDLRAFYTGTIGRVVRRVLQKRIREIWPDVQGMRVMGGGYAIPYLRMFSQEAERVFAVMPAAQGAHHWPSSYHERNLVCLSEESELPFDNASIDRILLIHSLEFAEILRPKLREVSRVLRPGGRILAIVPNRAGLWARAEWSPFGRGTPYSASQIRHYLQDNGFKPERTEEALFMPPVKFSPFLKSAGLFETVGRKILPVAAGVHLVEATRQPFPGAGRGVPSRVTVRGRGFIPHPAAQGL